MPNSPQRLTWTTAALLLVPPLMWAGNAIVGRLMQGSIPPITFNLLRWVLAFVLLLPLAAWVLRPGSGLLTHWRRFALLGLLSVSLYNALQYMALKTSTPINVTLVAASMPVWMLLVGRLLSIDAQVLSGGAVQSLTIETPLVDLTDVQLLDLFADSDAPLTGAMVCQAPAAAPGQWTAGPTGGCGRCGACRRWTRAMREAGLA